MRILFAIAHFFNPDGNGKHASVQKNPLPRVQALSGAISSLHYLFGKFQVMLDIARRVTIEANQIQSSEIDIVVCTTGQYHLLSHLSLPPHLYQHHSTQAEPMLLGFECQALLRDCLGKYDYYCFLEDDLIILDPWFFIKLNWFSSETGVLNLLQPNRYEISPKSPVSKAYIDGYLAPRTTAKFQNLQQQPKLIGKVMGKPILFRRALNPHSGSYFLNADQMSHWVKKPYFLDRDISFIGPLESAATLGVMKTFRIYKPAVENASFLEIQHYNSRFLSLIGKEFPLPNFLEKTSESVSDEKQNSEKINSKN